jgi:hypothetical protein
MARKREAFSYLLLRHLLLLCGSSGRSPCNVAWLLSSVRLQRQPGDHTGGSLRGKLEENAICFGVFPYACPEPVLDRFIMKNGAKDAFPYVRANEHGAHPGQLLWTEQQQTRHG